jgi:crotonobetainyl-CoA:carnitine CoA-transferase CaiB-like acyl-CoA transferase
VLGRPDIATDTRFETNPKRVANRPALDAVISEVFSSAPRDTIIDRLETARIAYGRVSTLDDLKAHPQNRYVDVQSPSGPVRLLAPGMLVDGALLDLGPVPAIGEHSEALRKEFG